MLKISLLFKKLTSRANNLRVIRIKNAKSSGYCLDMDTNIYSRFSNFHQRTFIINYFQQFFDFFDIFLVEKN